MTKMLTLAASMILLSPMAQAENYRIGSIDFTRPWTNAIVQGFLQYPDRIPLLLNGQPVDISKIGQLYPEGYKASSMKLSISPVPATAVQKHTVKVTDIPAQPDGSVNPFLVSATDFLPGSYLPVAGQPKGEAPAPTAKDVAWFTQQVQKNLLPDIFVIGGHHVISEGFESSAEIRYIFEPSLFKTVAQNADARAYFDNVKIAILWGCNTLTNLEPHGPDGSYLSPEQIKATYESGPAGQAKMIGRGQVNTLDFYKTRLLNEYGEDSGPEKWAFTRDPKKEDCKGPGPSLCDVANIDRVMPDVGLYDGTHRYNEAINMQQLFRNAYLVLGFSTASPPEEVRAVILQSAIQAASLKLNLADTNVLEVIMNPQRSVESRKAAIQALREAWEQTSYKGNRGRPSGSITPAFPDIDNGNVLYLRQTKDSQFYSKYRP